MRARALNLNSPTAGAKACLNCRNGSNPVALVFAREVTEPVANLIKKIDEATVKNKDAKMGSYVVFLNDNEDLPKKLKTWCDKEKIQECVLSVDNPAGPRGYSVSKDADVTVLFYIDNTVKANHAFAKGELKDKDIDAIGKDVHKIVT